MECRNIVAMTVYCMVVERFFAAAKEISRHMEQPAAILQTAHLLKKATTDKKEQNDEVDPDITEVMLEVIEFISTEACAFSLEKGIEEMKYVDFDRIEAQVRAKVFERYAHVDEEKNLKNEFFKEMKIDNDNWRMTF